MPRPNFFDGDVDFCELVEARDDPAVLFQPAKHTLDGVAFTVLGSVKQPGQARSGFALHRAQRNDRPHPIIVTVAAQRSASQS